MEDRLNQIEIFEKDRSDSNSQQCWEKMEKVMKETAVYVLGTVRRQNKKTDWFDDECKHVTDLKNKAYKNMIQDPRIRGKENEYKEIRTE